MTTIYNPKIAANDIIPTDRGNAYVVGTVEPVSPKDGMIWIDTTTAAAPIYKVYSNGAWVFGSWYHGGRTLLATDYTDHTTTGSTTSGNQLSTLTPPANIPPTMALEIWVTCYMTSTIAGSNRVMHLGIGYLNLLSVTQYMGEFRTWNSEGATSNTSTVYGAAKIFIPPRVVTQPDTKLMFIEQQSVRTPHASNVESMITGMRMPAVDYIQDIRLFGAVSTGTGSTMHLTTAMLFGWAA